jgi:hypothetical protein
MPSSRPRAVCFDIETARETPIVKKAMRTILSLDQRLRSAHADLARPTPQEIETSLASSGTAILTYLRYLSTHSPLPLVVFFDEAGKLFQRDAEYEGKTIRIMGG